MSEGTIRTSSRASSRKRKKKMNQIPIALGVFVIVRGNWGSFNFAQPESGSVLDDGYSVRIYTAKGALLLYRFHA